MSGPWVYKRGTTTLAVDRAALQRVLQPTIPHINRVADQAAAEARNLLPHPSMRRFIGVKHAGGSGGGNQGMWRLKLRGRRYGSGSGDRLMRGVEVPVALVTNDSYLAIVWEYGAVPVRALNVIRKRGKAKMKSGGHLTPYGVSEQELTRQYQPLVLAAQRVAARAVIRPRNIKGDIR